MRVILVALSMLFCSFSALAKTLVSIAVLPPTTGYWLVTNTSTVQLASLCTYSDASMDDCTYVGGVTWGSGRADFATVNSSGLVTGTGAGNSTVSDGTINGDAQIYAYNGSILGRAAIAVAPATISSMWFMPTHENGSSSTLVVGSSAAVSASANSNGFGVGQYCTWTSSNSSIVSVNAVGEITGVATGSATITCNINSVTAAQLITVTNPSVAGNTWYVRPNGGTRYDSRVTTGRCNGTANTDDPGSGTNQNCAFNNPMWCFTDNTSSSSYTGAVQAGDTCMILGGSTPYRVGKANPGTPWVTTAALNNTGIVPPSGTPAHPTRILGSNYSSCSGTPYSVGSRVMLVTNGSVPFEIHGIQNLDLECIDISSGQDCSQGVTGSIDFSCPNGSGNNFGLFVDGFTSNATFVNDRIHGYTTGLTGTPGPGLSMTGTTIEDNIITGLSFDDPWGFYGNRSDGFSGTYLVSSFNGCTDEQPKTLSSVSRNGSGTLTAMFAAGQIVNYVAGTNLVLSGMTPSDLNGTFPVSLITFDQQSVSITGGSVTGSTATFTTATAPTFSSGSFVDLTCSSPCASGYYEIYSVSGSGFVINFSSATRHGWTTGTIPSGGTAATAISVTATAAGSSESASTVGPASHVYPAHRCLDQADGGYANGDGVGTGSGTFNQWKCDHCTISGNTQDGWDMLHSNMTLLTLTNSQSDSNEGAPAKFGGFDTGYIYNNVLIANGGALLAFDPNKPPDFNQYIGMPYRAEDALELGENIWTKIYISNNTWETGFPTFLSDSCNSSAGCNSPVAGAYFIFQNNVVIGFNDTNSPYWQGEIPGFYCGFTCGNGSLFTNAAWTWDNNIAYNMRNTPSTGAGNQWSTNPLVTTLIPNISTFAGESAALIWNMKLTSSSPAIGAGIENAYTPSTDYTGVTRPNPPSMGALEYLGSTGTGGSQFSGGIVISGKTFQ